MRLVERPEHAGKLSLASMFRFFNCLTGPANRTLGRELCAALNEHTVFDHARQASGRAVLAMPANSRNRRFRAYLISGMAAGNPSPAGGGLRPIMPVIVLHCGNEPRNSDRGPERPG